MASYNNYGNYPYGMPYQPVMPQYNNMANNQMQQQPTQQPQSNTYYYVNGIIGAKSFQMQPNQSIMLMDSDSPMCYMKTTNGIGQATLRYFKLIEVNENELNNNVQQNNEYALKTDLESLNKKVEDILSKINGGIKDEQ